MWNFTHIKHFAKQFTNLNRGSTNQTWTSIITHFFYFIDYSSIFFSSRFVDAVFHIVTLNRTVSRNFYNIKFINIPELACFSRRCTSHTSQFMIHTEIILQSNSGKGLCGGFNFHMFFSLHSLV